MYRAQKTLIPDTGSTCTTCPLPPQSFLPPLQKGLFLHSALHLHTARHRAWTAGKAAPHRTQSWNCQLIQLFSYQIPWGHSKLTLTCTHCRKTEEDEDSPPTWLWRIRTISSCNPCDSLAPAIISSFLLTEVCLQTTKIEACLLVMLF